MGFKVCKGCGVEKDLDKFYAAARNLDGRMGKCKSCVKRSVRENRRNRIQQYAEYERSRANLPHRVEARRKYQEEHKEQIAEYKKAWTKANGLRTASSKRAYYEQYREEVIARSKEWAENNLEKVKRFKANNSRKRRAAKHASSGNFTVKAFEELCKRYGNKCLSCSSTGVALEADHVVPLTRGGSDDIDNIQPLCGTRNRSKSVKIVDYRAGENTLPGSQDLLGESLGLYHLHLDELSVDRADPQQFFVCTPDGYPVPIEEPDLIGPARGESDAAYRAGQFEAEDGTARRQVVGGEFAALGDGEPEACASALAGSCLFARLVLTVERFRGDGYGAAFGCVAYGIVEQDVSLGNRARLPGPC